MAESKLEKLVINPTQANWRKPFDLTDDLATERLSALARAMANYSAAHLERARDWLIQNRPGDKDWPAVSEWKAALTASAAPVTERGEYPWITRMKQARAIYRNEWAETTLAQDMDGLGVGSEFRSLVTRMIYDRLRKGVPLDHMVVPGEYIEHLKRKGESFLAAKGHRLSAAYAKTHGKPLKTAVNG